MPEHEPIPLTDDPRFSGLPASTVERAKSAHCSRCAAVVVDEPSIAGTLMLQYYVPALGVRQRAILCGACGLAFREFLLPSLAEDQTYQAVVAELRSRWA